MLIMLDVGKVKSRRHEVDYISRHRIADNPNRVVRSCWLRGHDSASRRRIDIKRRAWRPVPRVVTHEASRQRDVHRLTVGFALQAYAKQTISRCSRVGICLPPFTIGFEINQIHDGNRCASREGICAWPVSRMIGIGRSIQSQDAGVAAYAAITRDT